MGLCHELVERYVKKKTNKKNYSAIKLQRAEPFASAVAALNVVSTLLMFK